MKVYYDSNCVLCSRYKQAISFIAKNKIVWLDVNDEKIELPANYARSELLEILHVFTDDGNVHVGPDAFKAIIAAIPGAERFSWLMQQDSAKRALDVFYETSERLRRRLMKSCPSCQNKPPSV